MPFALITLFAVLALLIISVLLAALFTLLIKLNPGPFGGPVAWKKAALIAIALLGAVWLLILLNTLFAVVVALPLAV
jgi:hypothetical protein